MTDQCFCCAQEYNNSTRKKITCPFGCEFSSCKECVRTFLLGSASDPKCMNCNISTNQKYKDKDKVTLRINHVMSHNRL